MTVANVFAFSAMATEFGNGRSLTKSGIFTRDHLNVAKDSSPTRCAGALIRLINLFASSSVEARALSGLSRKKLRSRMRNTAHGTPIDEAFATRSGESIWAVAKIRSKAIAASGSVETRVRVAFVDPELAV